MAKMPYSWLTCFGLAALTSSNAAALSEDQAINRLIKIARRDALYASWTKLECLAFTTESTSIQYFDIAIREKHEGKCPGDPGVNPIIDKYRVFRESKKILWYRPNDGELMNYNQVKARRRK